MDHAPATAAMFDSAGEPQRAGLTDLDRFDLVKARLQGRAQRVQQRGFAAAVWADDTAPAMLAEAIADRIGDSVAIDLVWVSILQRAGADPPRRKRVGIHLGWCATR